MESGERVDRGKKFAERIVFVSAGEGQKGKEAGLERAESAIGEGLLKKNFEVTRNAGSEGAGIEEMSGEKKDGLEGLASWALGGEKRR